MDLAGRIEAKRSAAELEVELDAWQGARKTTELLRSQVLPSEEGALRRMSEEALRQTARLEAERRFLGRLDLEALLKQRRPGPAPRWFLYDPMTPLDAVHWSPTSTIQFNLTREERTSHVIRLGFENPFPKTQDYRAAPILLPARIREQVIRLRGENIVSYVLYEPRVVHSAALPEPQPIPLPDPALIVEAGGQYFVVDVWDDPAVEDPRALATLREFFVSFKTPDWLRRRT